MSKTNVLGHTICKFIGVRPIYKNVQLLARTPMFYCQNVSCTKESFMVQANFLYRGYTTQKLVNKVEVTDEQAELDSEEYYSNYIPLEYDRVQERKKTKSRLQKLLQTSTIETDKIVGEYPALLRLFKEQITENINYFEQLGLETSVLKSEPWLLTLRKTAIAELLPYFHKMGLKDINMIAPLLYFPLQRVKQASFAMKNDSVLVIPCGSRINYLSKHLQNNQIDMWKIAIKHQFLLSMSFQRLSTILELLLGYGMSPQNILNDMWVFRYSSKTVEFRLKQAQEAGVKVLKPWIVRCPDTVLEITLRRTVDSRKTLGSHSTALEYLSQRLECSLDEVIALTKRYPPLLTVHVLKQKEVLDFLYEEGFTSRQVCQVPRVLCNSLETLQERLSEIRDLGHNPLSLIVLCKSKRQYSEYLKKLLNLKKLSFSI